MEHIEAQPSSSPSDRDVSVDVTDETKVVIHVDVDSQTQAIAEVQQIEHPVDDDVDVKLDIDVDTQTHSKVDSLETVSISQETTSTPPTSSPLIDLFISILKAQNPDIVRQLNLNLNAEMTDCLLFILNNHPDYFSDFGKLLSLILEDGKINMNDIPYIHLLVSKTYEFVHHFKKNIKNINDEKTFEVCANIMKIVFHVLIMKNVINIKYDNKEVLVSTFDSIIDSSVHLVKLSNVLNNKGCTCFSFFKSKSSKESKTKSE